MPARIELDRLIHLIQALFDLARLDKTAAFAEQALGTKLFVALAQGVADLDDAARFAESLPHRACTQRQCGKEQRQVSFHGGPHCGGLIVKVCLMSSGR